MDTDQIDQLGQDIFNKLCHNDNLVVNPSIGQDQAGWDYIIQSKTVTKDDALSDQSLSACFIQLKTTTNSKYKRWPVSLSNLMSLSKQHAPCFYCLVVLDNKKDCKEVYLKLLDNVLMSRTLKEVHVTDLDKLSKVKIGVNFNLSNKLNLRKGETIKLSIQKLIGNYSEYVRKKNEFFKSAGIEESMVFNFSTKEELRNFIYLLLGYKKKINLSQANLIQKRFGSMEKSLQLQGSTLSIQETSPFCTGTLELFFDKVPQNLVFKVNFYSLPSSFFSSDFDLTRVEGVYFDFFYNPNQVSNKQVEFKYNFKKFQSLNVNEYVKTTKLIYLLQKNPNNAVMILKLSSGGSQRLVMENFNSIPIISDEHIKFIEDAKRIIDELDLPNYTHVTKKDIELIDHARLIIANYIISRKSFCIASDKSNELNDKFLVEFKLSIANCEIVFIFVAMLSSKAVTTYFNDIYLLKSIVIVNKDQIATTSAETFINEFCSEKDIERLVL
ncbi:hypothetical protein [Legionella sainthelensi]|uniref:hypothetical protein n=1 Tax=Legionella sainthelensi TaxID=28087 RepID=UPI000E202BC8|nr:hypothetical protein [Legionella sainthelensi]